MPSVLKQRSYGSIFHRHPRRGTSICWTFYPFYYRVKYAHGDWVIYWFIDGGKDELSLWSGFRRLQRPYYIPLVWWYTEWFIHHVNCICEYCTRTFRLIIHGICVRLTTNDLFSVLYIAAGNNNVEGINYFAISHIRGRIITRTAQWTVFPQSASIPWNFVKYCYFRAYLDIFSIFYYLWTQRGFLMYIFARTLYFWHYW